MQQYLTKADMHKDKYVYAKDDANPQRKTYIKVDAIVVWEIAKKNCK